MYPSFELGFDKRKTRLLRFALATTGAVAVSVGVAEVLREEFGTARLLAKAIAPVAYGLVAATLFPPGRLRSWCVAVVSVLAMTALTALCLGVYGVPLDAGTLVPILGLTAPEPNVIYAALGLLVGALILGSRLTWAPLPARTAPDLLIAAAEAVYFGGFLLGSTRNLGAWAWGIVGVVMTVGALSRGVPVHRSLLGAAAFVAATVWSANTYVAALVHVGLIGGSREAPRSRLSGPLGHRGVG